MTAKPVAFLLADLGATKSHSRPHCSNDHPYSESQFTTMKYRPTFPDRFGSYQDATPSVAGSSAGIAVGTALAGGPPRRSQRALLTHWAPDLGSGVEAFVGPGMGIAGGREPSFHVPAHLLPVQAVSLAAAPKRPVPMPHELVAEGRHLVDVARDGVVRQMAT